MLKLLHLNIQGTANIERVTSFIESNLPDVCCLQEVFLGDITVLAEHLGYQVFFSDMNKEKKEGELPFGLAILSKAPAVLTEDITFAVSEEGYKQYFHFNLLGVTVEDGSNKIHFMTTHLPVNYPGEVLSLFQLSTFEKLKEKLSAQGDSIFTGDFNSPRGMTSIFDTLARMYKDNVPAHIDSTIDPVLHRAKGIKYVVDGIFSTPSYKVSDVEIYEGVSDHKGIMAYVSFL